MRGHGDIRRVADNLIAHAPLSVRVLARQVQRARDDAHTRIVAREAAAEVFKVRPVVAVEALADLRAHVAEEEGLVHGGLGELCVGGGRLVAPVVAGAEVVFEQGAEERGEGLVFEEFAVAAVAVAGGEGGGGDVFGDLWGRGG